MGPRLLKRLLGGAQERAENPGVLRLIVDDLSNKGLGLILLCPAHTTEESQVRCRFWLSAMYRDCGFAAGRLCSWVLGLNPNGS